MRHIMRDDLPEIPVPNYDDPKEVFAFFGLAYYQATVLEHGVLNLAIALLAKARPSITGEIIDRLYGSFDKKTFGQMIGIVKSKLTVPKDLEADLIDALSSRNYLAHGFFVDHATDFLSASGQRKMIDELISILKQLQSVDVWMDELWISAWDSLGFSREWIEKEMRIYASARRELN